VLDLPPVMVSLQWALPEQLPCNAARPRGRRGAPLPAALRAAAARAA